MFRESNIIVTTGIIRMLFSIINAFIDVENASRKYKKSINENNVLIIKCFLIILT